MKLVEELLVKSQSIIKRLNTELKKKIEEVEDLKFQKSNLSICNVESTYFFSHNTDISHLEQIHDLGKENTMIKKKLKEYTEMYERCIFENQSLIDKYNLKLKTLEVTEEILLKEKKSTNKLEEENKCLKLELEEKNQKIKKFSMLFERGLKEEDNNKPQSKSDESNFLISDKWGPEICKYLNFKDMIFVKNTNKFLYNKLKVYSKIQLNIKCQLIAIKSIDNYVSKKTSNESQFTFSQFNKESEIPGLQLKNQILLSINFLEKNVKTPLGIKSIIDPNISKKLIQETLQEKKDKETPKKEKNFFESLKSMINNDKLQKTPSNFFDYDFNNELLINYLQKLNLNFDYSLEEINELLSKVIHEGFTNDFLIDFYEDINKLFSSLLYFSAKVITDIKKIHYRNEYLLKFFNDSNKKLKEYQDEITMLKSYNKTSKEIKEILSKQKSDLEINYSSCKNDITLLQQSLEKVKNEKLLILGYNNKMQKENEIVRIKLINDYTNIKKNFDYLYEQKSKLVSSILSFKSYFIKQNITEDGEILEINN